MSDERSAAYNATRVERFEKWLPVKELQELHTTLPLSSLSSAVEAEWHAAADLFCAHFHEYYPHRAPLLLTPLNEWNARKIICTFIKPTVLPFEELFDLPTCAQFVAGYMRYERLEDPEKLPGVVVSPATALQWQIANCFELSLLLVSLLSGAGYNAYVVVGCAKQFVCENDYSGRLWGDTDCFLNESDVESEEESKVEIDAEYAALVKERPVLRGVSDHKPPASFLSSNLQELQQEEGQKSKAEGLKDKQQEQRRCSFFSYNAVSHLVSNASNNNIPIAATSSTTTISAAAALDKDQLTGRGATSRRPRVDIWAPSNNTQQQNREPRLLHSWVLVLPGGRKSQKESVFVEPSTGELIQPNAADIFYTSIDSIFNRSNYYVNVAPECLVSMLTLDLENGTEWEGVVFDTDAEEERDMIACISSSTAGGATERSNASPIIGVRWRQPHNVELNATAPGVTAVAASTLGGSGIVGINTFAPAATVNVFSSTGRDKSLRPSYISWVRDLTLSREQYETKYPGGMKVIRYTNAEVRWFAEYTRPDHRVIELRLPDPNYQHRWQIHIFFKHRADKLRRCSLYPNNKVYTDDDSNSLSDNAEFFSIMKKWYDRGRMREASVEGLRLLTHEFGVKRTMTFYWEARDDGLWRRQELFYEGCVLRKVKEFYRGRDDRLWYRGATFERSSLLLRVQRQRGSVFGDRQLSDETQRVDPVRVSEKYHRNEALSADDDVAKYTFVRFPDNTGGGEMWVYFHYRSHSITRPYRMYLKTSRGEEYLASAAVGSTPLAPQCKMVLMPNMERPSVLEQYNERKRLAWLECVAVGKVRGMMSECAAILSSVRDTDVKAVCGVISVFDTLRNRPRETEVERARKLAENAAREASREDYLAPYIAKLELPRGFDGDYLNVVLTPEQALRVRDEALRELKERLIQRGHIMQAQMDAEKKNFNERQTAYQDKVDAAGLDAGRDEEEFAQYCKEATWRMKALDERLSKHIDHSSEKYAKLAQRLAEDPRLAALYKT